MAERKPGEEDFASWHPKDTSTTPAPETAAEVPATPEASDQKSELKILSDRFDILRQAFLDSGSSNKQRTSESSPMEVAMEQVRDEIELFGTDFEIIFREPEEFGGGFEKQKGRIPNMAAAAGELEAMIDRAAEIADSDESLQPYREQIKVARIIAADLKNSIRGSNVREGEASVAVEAPDQETKLRQLDDRLDILRQAFIDSGPVAKERAPDSSPMEAAMQAVRDEIKSFSVDLDMMFREPKQYGGGFEENKGRIPNMAAATGAFEGMIDRAAEIADSDKSFQPYRAQIEVARVIAADLKKHL